MTKDCKKKREKLLTEVADKRLKAIKEFTQFGSKNFLGQRKTALQCTYQRRAP
jgi:transcription-repair coupling factor (superfamily II helicase)